MVQVRDEWMSPRTANQRVQDAAFLRAEEALHGIDRKNKQVQQYELQQLERVLRDGDEKTLDAVHKAIVRKIGWQAGSGDERAFLEAFYTALRAKLEGDMRLGQRKADKHTQAQR